MLLWLTDYLSQFLPAFGVFQYLTFRTMVSAGTAMFLSLTLGPMLIRKLSSHQIGEVVREDGPSSHQSKAGTPTMGGALILVVILTTTILWGDLGSRYVLIVLSVTLAFGAIGWIDDYVKISRSTAGHGLSAKWKYFFQSVFGFAAAVVLYRTASSVVDTALIVPFFKAISIPLGTFGFIFLGYLIIVGMSNAVNLTDGLDGLAIMPTVIVSAALGLIAYLVGNIEFSTYLQIPYVPGAGELSVFCGALIGAGLGFLWFNAYPAQIFMGDTGSLALGSAIGTVGVMVRHEIVLLIMGGLFVLEAFSVIVQVTAFKLTGKRVFRMAPIHHHFELKGWPEPKIIVRFWIITLMLVMLGLSTLKLR